MKLQVIFLSLIVLALCDSAQAQVNPRSFCGSTTIAIRNDELTRAQGRCERATARMSVLEQRRQTKDARDDQYLNDLGARYGARIATCAVSYIGQGEPATACAGLADRELVRAERWAREYVRITLRKNLRGEQLEADLYEVSQACGYVTELQQLIAWRTVVCGG